MGQNGCFQPLSPALKGRICIKSGKKLQKTGNQGQTVYKPGSVRIQRMAVIIHLGCPLPDTSSNLPRRRPGNRPCAASIWSCSRRGLPCHCRYRQRGALLPHPFSLTLSGGLLSVALSLESPPPDVIRRRASVEPGLSSPACAGAITQLSDPKS